MAWIWFGRHLTVNGGKLYGQNRLFGSEWRIIRPEDIEYATEYNFNNRFVLVRASGKNYTARPWSSEYWEIVDFIEGHTRFRLKDRFAHKINRLFYRPL